MKTTESTLSAVAQHAGVSIATVSRVVNGMKSVNPELQERVEQSLRELNYVPKQKSTPVTPAKKSLRIAFLANDIFDDSYKYLLRGALDVAAAMNIDLTLYETKRSEEREKDILHYLEGAQIDGIISLANLSNLNSDYQRLISARFPIVFLVNPNDPKMPKSAEFNMVTSSASEGAHSAIKYLLDLGHRDILYLGDPKTPRFSGYRRAFEQVGIAPRPELAVDCGDVFEDAYAYIKRDFTGKRYTAILGASENITMGCWFSLNEMNHKIPAQCSLIGYGNSMLMKHLSITCISEPLEEIGKNAVYLLNDCIARPTAQPQKVVLQDSLVVRNSCKRL